MGDADTVAARDLGRIVATSDLYDKRARSWVESDHWAVLTDIQHLGIHEAARYNCRLARKDGADVPFGVMLRELTLLADEANQKGW